MLWPWKMVTVTEKRLEPEYWPQDSSSSLSTAAPVPPLSVFPLPINVSLIKWENFLDFSPAEYERGEKPKGDKKLWTYLHQSCEGPAQVQPPFHGTGRQTCVWSGLPASPRAEVAPAIQHRSVIIHVSHNTGQSKSMPVTTQVSYNTWCSQHSPAMQVIHNTSQSQHRSSLHNTGQSQHITSQSQHR